ncbi:hypothetical protein NCU00530 [Neurospora crassa OR74A]|uniref:Uncharacterized protein n=1 Tax=Neurospora crassa (strain ATCC 24698 / 74-OR23-1A / CBS 708.71 / DSM 1257 / FGSC 987) TaxID=367110 RepID=Q7SDL4_NEUCR|nr:hypothetical protein NCU00530 [Neurospora crassa OR74A]EAA34846.1 hypothetical protein NCU00530 [Neurospora crassa OR74A]|eukprot:XP_964082.1 hypothetical protein NCU00530 [Neurospora crassa OR74A]
MPHISFDSDYDPSVSLLEQARQLVRDRQNGGVSLWDLLYEQGAHSRGVSLWDLLCEQGACVQGCTPGTIRHLFHSMVLVPVLKRLGGHENGDGAGQGEDE